MAVGLKMSGGDFVTEGKSVLIVENYEKLSRDLLKFLSTDAEYASNKTEHYRYNPKYGVTINNMELYTNLSPESRIDVVKQYLTNSIKYYISLQESRANISLGEVISNIDLYVFQSLDPKKIKIKIDVYTPTGEKQELGTFTQDII